MQQNEVLHWQAEGTGSMGDVRSVCSCSLTCEPFRWRQRKRERLRGGRAASINESEAAEVAAAAAGTYGSDLNNRRCSTAMRWYSSDSLQTSCPTPKPPSYDRRLASRMSRPRPGSPVDKSGCEIRPPVSTIVTTHGGGGKCVSGKKSSSKKKGVAKKKAAAAAVVSAQQKAGSVHDLRRCAVSSLLKVPPQYTMFESKQRLPLLRNEAGAVSPCNIGPPGTGSGNPSRSQEAAIIVVESVMTTSSEIGGREAAASAATASTHETGIQTLRHQDAYDNLRLSNGGHAAFGRLVKLAKSLTPPWKIISNNLDHSGQNSDADQNGIPLEELDNNALQDHQKRVSL